MSLSSEDDQDGGLDVGGISHVYAGYADGTLKKWNLKENNCVLHIEKQTQKEQKKSGPCYMWKLQIFESYLISGDSKGEVCIWD